MITLGTSLIYSLCPQVVSALASCRSIVTPAWLEEAVTHLTAGKVLPSCVDFLPDVVDGNIDSGSQGISFKPDYKRMSLLQDRVFFFLTEKQVLIIKPYSVYAVCRRNGNIVLAFVIGSPPPPPPPDPHNYEGGFSSYL